MELGRHGKGGVCVTSRVEAVHVHARAAVMRRLPNMAVTIALETLCRRQRVC